MKNIITPISTASTIIKDSIMGPANKVRFWFNSVATKVKRFGGIVTKIAGVVGKVFAPIAIVTTAWETITGIIEGWKEEGFLWQGPQSSNDIGEKWVVPAPNNNRPYLGRGRREQRVWSIKKRFDVTDLILQYKEQGGRLYVTFNGYLVSPIPITRIRHFDVLGQLKSLNAKETTQISARWIKDRLKRVQSGYGAVPYAMFVLGKLDGNVEQSITDIQNVRDDDEIDSR